MESSTASQLQWLIDRALISDLLCSFAAALDTKDWAAYVENYAAGGCIDLPDPKSTDGARIVLPKSGMLEALPKSLGRYSATHHISTNHQIAIAGLEANSRSYLQAVHVSGPLTNHWTAGGWYDCQFRREPSGWKFTQVRLTAVWLEGEIRAIAPGA